MRNARRGSSPPPGAGRRTRPTASVPPRCTRSPSRRPHEVALVEKPDPELEAPTDAIVRVEATGVCGSDLHIYHGRDPDRARLHDRPRVRRHRRGRRRRGHLGRGRRPGARLLPGRLRRLLLLPPRRLPQVRRVADLRPRRRARRPAGHPGRARARPARQPDAAPRARGALRRRRAVRRRRRRAPATTRPSAPASARATSRSSSASARWGCARCRRRSSAGPRRSSRSTRSRSGSTPRAPSAPSRSTSPSRTRKAEVKRITERARRRPRRRGGRRRRARSSSPSA